ncbi:MAG TPA: UbiA family prenyltransferase [Nocardioides sp.]|nr:UbiA family prenyltransferase [Nocardioides sp.]
MGRMQRKRRSSAEEGTTTALAEVDEPTPGQRRRPPRGTGRLSVRRLRDAWPLLMVQAAHPRQAVATAVGVGAVAALAGRPTREVGVVLLTVLVGQSILGWHNDLVDRERDARHDTPRKPIADGRLDPGSVWYSITIAVLLLVPLAISTGVIAGINYLISVIIGLLANVALRQGVFSWVPWALSFALYPAYISYGGWGGEAEGPAPEAVMTLLAGLLGIGVHFLRSIWGLVADNEDGWTYLPLRLGLRLGATRLLMLTSAYLIAVLVALAIAGSMTGLSQ